MPHCLLRLLIPHQLVRELEDAQVSLVVRQFVRPRARPHLQLTSDTSLYLSLEHPAYVTAVICWRAAVIAGVSTESHI